MRTGGRKTLQFDLEKNTTPLFTFFPLVGTLMFHRLAYQVLCLFPHQHKVNPKPEMAIPSKSLQHCVVQAGTWVPSCAAVASHCQPYQERSQTHFVLAPWRAIQDLFSFFSCSWLPARSAAQVAFWGQKKTQHLYTKKISFVELETYLDLQYGMAPSSPVLCQAQTTLPYGPIGTNMFSGKV